MRTWTSCVGLGPFSFLYHLLITWQTSLTGLRGLTCLIFSTSWLATSMVLCSIGNNFRLTPMPFAQSLPTGRWDSIPVLRHFRLAVLLAGRAIASFSDGVINPVPLFSRIRFVC